MINASPSTRIKNVGLILFSICCCILVFIRPSIPQDPSYHSFADHREIFGIPNFWNVITNLPFVIIGFIGLVVFLQRREKENYSMLAYFTLFIGVMGIGFGSAWYHYNPNNTTLVWDRIPMTITFMSYFSIIVSRYVNKKFGNAILLPALVLGAFSVFYWYWGEQNGHGDLRLYALIQFYPMLVIPIILFLYPASGSVRIKIVSVILVYAIAKIAEQGDEFIFNFNYLISGHSLKHILASVSVLLILLTLNGERRSTA